MRPTPKMSKPLDWSTTTFLSQKPFQFNLLRRSEAGKPLLAHELFGLRPARLAPQLFEHPPKFGFDISTERRMLPSDQLRQCLLVLTISIVLND